MQLGRPWPTFLEMCDTSNLLFFLFAEERRAFLKWLWGLVKDGSRLPSWNCGTTFWDNPRRVIGDFCHLAKLGWNHCSSFDNMNIWIFCTFGLRKPFHTPKMSFLGFDPLKWEAASTQPQHAHACEETCHMMHRSSKWVKRLLRYSAFHFCSRWQLAAILDLWGTVWDN